VLYAVEPVAILFSSLLSTEAMFTAILMVGVYHLVKYLRRQLQADLLVAAGALAASIYVRPVGYFLPLIIGVTLGVWTLVSGYQNKPRLLGHLSAFLVVSFALTGLWRIRNEIATGYSGFSSVFSDDMYCNMAAAVLAAKQRLSYCEVQDSLGCYDLGIYFQDHPKQKTQPIGQILKYKRDRAVLIFLRNPLTFARIYLEGVIRCSFDPLSTEFLRVFDLYPKDGGLLETAIDNGIIKTLEALFLNRLLAWSTVVLLTVQLVYLSGACITPFKASIRDPAILIVLVIMGYYLALPLGAGTATPQCRLCVSWRGMVYARRGAS
jgi:hypothetical protein